MSKRLDQNAAEHIRLLTKSLENLNISRSRSRSRSRSPETTYIQYKQPLKKASTETLKQKASTSPSITPSPAPRSQGALEQRIQILDCRIQRQQQLIVKCYAKLEEQSSELHRTVKKQGKAQTKGWIAASTLIGSILILILIFVILIAKREYLL